MISGRYDSTKEKKIIAGKLEEIVDVHFLLGDSRDNLPQIEKDCRLYRENISVIIMPNKHVIRRLKSETISRNVISMIIGAR